MREAALEIARQTETLNQSVAETLIGRLTAPFRRLRNMATLASVMRTLRRLDDRQLADIGLTRLDVDALATLNEPAGATLARIKARTSLCAWECTPPIERT